MDDPREVYKEEASDLLIDLESTLIELEEAPRNMELINQVFRAMHTIKGSGAMFGFDDIAAFTHEIETVFDQVRNQKVLITKNLIEQTLLACDVIRKMIDGDPVSPDIEKNIVKAFIEVAASASTPESCPDDTLVEEPDEEDEPHLYRIRFQPNEDVFKNGTNPLFLLEELESLGQWQCVLYQNRIPTLDALDPELCYLKWDILLSTEKGFHSVRDIFIFIEDECRLDIQLIDSFVRDSDSEINRLGEILVARGDVTPEAVESALQKEQRIGETLIERDELDHDALQSALAEQEKLREQTRKKRQAIQSSSVRVASDKLDDLINMVGELVTVQARLFRKAAALGDAELTAISEEVERLTANLRDGTMTIRMVPVGNIFRKFKRLVYDLSTELQKEVRLEIKGEETTLDKTVLAQLDDPLVHIIRNCVDHGIESPDEREACGKPRQGLVRLSAEHSGNNVMIKITDDGKGLDPESLQKKAVERGLIPAEGGFSDQELFSLIFSPGFSTALSVSGISGRGVGMDVVKRRMERLRGSIEIESRKGEGVSIILKLPLTLAIEDGLMVRVENENYVLPLFSVEECIELSGQKAEKARQQSFVNVRGEVVSYINLRELFEGQSPMPDSEMVVIVSTGNQRVAFGVDAVVTHHQIVVKNLGPLYKNVKWIAGATVMGDGSISLILDVASIIHSARSKDY